MASASAPEDLKHLRRCVELAAQAVDAGDEAFGSVLVDADGTVLREARNRVGGGAATAHPELELALWAQANVDAAQRPAMTVYTSGEHCPMCSAAHAWVGLGAIVYATSSAQLVAWRADWDLPDGPVVPLPIESVAPGILVRGPAPELADQMRLLHARVAGVAPTNAER